MIRSTIIRGVVALACALLGQSLFAQSSGNPSGVVRHSMYRCPVANGSVEFTTTLKSGCIVLFTYDSTLKQGTQAKDSPRLMAESSDCESGFSIRSVLADGKIITLDDGSVWEVDGSDTSDSSTWTSGDEIVVCSDKLVNTDEDESVDATRIK